MITPTISRGCAATMAKNNGMYAPVFEKRATMKHQYYQVNDNVCFEYWNKNDWEFTMTGEMDAEKAKYYEAMLVIMTVEMQNTNVSFSRIPSLLAKCRALLTLVDQKLEARHTNNAVA